MLSAGEYDENLLEFSQLFLSNSRVFPWKKAKSFLKSYEGQKQLFEQTIGHKLSVEYPPASVYLDKFIKTWINETTDCEVIEEVYDHLGSLLLKPKSQHGYKIYSFDKGSTYFKINETVSMCSKGTTGLQTWQACLYMCQWCFVNKDLFANRGVIELGCGAGLLGCTIGKVTECSQITLTDHHQSVLISAQHNLNMNNVSRADVACLDWTTVGEEMADNFKCDIIVAADVVFDPSIIPHLVRTIERILLASADNNPVCYLCSTKRNKDTYDLLLKLLNESRLSFSITNALKFDFYVASTDVIELLKIVNC